MVENPHDRWAKAVFSRPGVARALFEVFLPPDLLRVLDLDDLELMPGSFVDEGLAESHTDLLFRCGSGWRSKLLYLLFEHKSWVDPALPHQLHRYVARIHARHLESQPQPCRVPAVIPLVLYHGERPWSGPRGLADMTDASAEELAGWGDLVARQDFVLIDVTWHEDLDLRRVAGRGAPLGSLALLSLKHHRARDYLAHLRSWGDLLRRTYEEGRTGLEALRMLLCYIWSTREATDVPDVVQVVASVTGPETEAMATTFMDHLIEKGFTKGIEQGLRQSLRVVLTSRFGVIPPEFEARLAELSAPLQIRLERAVTVASLREFFDEGNASAGD